MTVCKGYTHKGIRCKNQVSNGKRRYCQHHNSKHTMKYCRKKLAEKIRANMHEYKERRWTSRKQAIAVSFSQVRRKYPKCKEVLRKK